MLIYENVFIGNFLFGIGAIYGYRHSGNNMPPACINLLQQTPMDSRLGDVLLETSAFVRILEFKRPENPSKKESRKLRMLVGSIGGSARMSAISRRIHWYVELTADIGGKIVPYLDLEQPSSSTLSLSEFMSQTMDAMIAGTEEADMTWCREYLRLLMKCAGGATSAGSGALIVAMTQDGRLQYATVRDVGDLRLTHEELLKREQFLAQERETPTLRPQKKLGISL